MPRAQRPSAEPDVASIAALLGDRARASMILALLDGQELPASALACRASVSPQAASAHLSKLVAGGLLTVDAAGRQRRFRIVSPDVAHAVEALAAIAKPTRVVALSQSTAMERLREARSCYDHLAGRLGVAITDRFIERGAIVLRGDAFSVTRAGEKFFAALDVDVERARDARRSFARPCIDWTERRPHLAGSLGVSVLERFLANGWLARNPNDRALRITPAGRQHLARRFDVSV